MNAQPPVDWQTDVAVGLRSRARSIKNNVGTAALVLWFVGMTMVVASLMLKHLAALPPPDDLMPLRRTVAALHAGGRPLILHVIYRECSCTGALFDHLIARKPFRHADERILFLGADPQRQRTAETAGFHFKIIDAGYLREELGAEAAPLLIVTDRKGELRYVGGYYDHPAAIHALDEKIYAAVSRGETVEPLPLFGCAVNDGRKTAGLF